MTETTHQRRRAPGMSPEQRRDMIVRAALPLVAEFGMAVTTQQVARAAGIGEATIFRVFADKDALIDACVAEALDSTHVLSELSSIPLDQPLAARLVEAVDALHGFLGRMGTVIGALHASGRPLHRPEFPAGAQGDQRPAAHRRELAFTETRVAIAELLEPDAAALRLPVDRLADLFLGLTFSLRRLPDPDRDELTPEELVDIFLNGVVTD